MYIQDQTVHTYPASLHIVKWTLPSYFYWFSSCSLISGSILGCSGVQPAEKASIPLKTAPLQAPTQKPVAQIKKAASPKVIDLNAKQVCKRKGCGNTFTEKENNSTACNYHPGPAVFHDRQKGVSHDYKVTILACQFTRCSLQTIEARCCEIVSFACLFKYCVVEFWLAIGDICAVGLLWCARERLRWVFDDTSVHQRVAWCKCRR